MQKNDFSFDLPKELIAQAPLKSREESRLLCLDRITGQVTHSHFYKLQDKLSSGDCLVLNDSRVLPARLLGSLETGGFAEVLLLSQQGCLWECLVRPGKKIKKGTRLVFGNGELTATVRDVLENSNRLVEFHYDGVFQTVLESFGKMPLPPYIQKELKDAERYQTVYSRELGSAAAPTAGLHFTHEMLLKLEQSGVNICYLTLHVGLGTFRPVKTDLIHEHKMHAEYFSISEESASIINLTKEKGGRVVAVGTTSCRTIESVADINGMVSAKEGYTDIFIYPGYEFKCIDGLITNFHLPESTLIMLVSAFAGRESTLEAYKEAIKMNYRFYSFGDAMIII